MCLVVLYDREGTIRSALMVDSSDDDPLAGPGGA